MSTKKKTSLTEAARDAITGYTVIVLSIVCFILVLMLIVAAARILSGFNTTSQATTKPSTTTTTTTTNVKNYHAGAYIVATTNQSVASYDANTTDTGATSAQADLANTAVYRVYCLSNTNGAA